MKEKITNALLIILIVIVCILGMIFYSQAELQQEQIKYMNAELNSTKSEISKMQNELKHNDNIVLKVLEKEW